MEDEVLIVDYSGKDWIFFYYMCVKIVLKFSEVILRIVKKDIIGDIVLEN